MSARLICLLFTLCLFVRDILLPVVVAQSGITQMTANLSEARFYLAASSSGELVFFGGGFSATGVSNLVDIYNVTSGSWTTATLSIPRWALAAASSGILVFFAGGANATGFSNQVDIYVTTYGIWSTATLSRERCFLAATSVGNLVLFGGGSNALVISNVVDIHDVTNNMWTTATLSQARAGLTATSVANRYVLFAGGLTGTVETYVSNVVDIFDSLSRLWNTTTLSQARELLAATSLGNLAFFGGGNGTCCPSPTFNTVDIFNATTQTWSTATLSQNRTSLAAASIGDIVAFGGGYDGSEFSAVVDMYNATSDIWFAISLSQPREFLAATSLTNKIFFGGGVTSSSSSGVSYTVDIFDIPLPPLPPSNTGTLPLSSSAVSSAPTSGVPSAGQGAPFSSLTLHSNTSTGTVSYSVNGTLIGGLIGGIVGALLVAGGIVVVVILLRKKRKNKKLQKESNSKEMSQPEAIRRREKETITQSANSLLKRSQSITFTDLVVEKKIGTGSYGKVCLGKWNAAPVALKFCRKKGNVEDFMREIRLMIELPPHPNVVQWFGVSLDGPQPIIVLEYCAGGSLDQLLFQTNVILSDEQKIRLVRGIAAGMLHLHKHNIVHRDLAARNILLTASGVPKISDFGMSRILEKDDEGKTNSTIGPACWMAPESLAHRNYSKKSDVWTFGIVIYEIVAQCEPHKDQNLFEVVTRIRDEGLTPTIPTNCPPKLRELMQMCWKMQPEQRPNFEAICALLEQ
jgi:hypothetical protein